jgi:hypothetical protein
MSDRILSASVLSSLHGQRAVMYLPEAILQEMQELYRVGDADVKPDTIAFASVIHAYANSRYDRGAHKAGSIIQEMQHLHDRGIEM